MTDLVERLAHVAVWCQSNDLPLFAATAAEAKTEIERLQTAIRDMIAAIPGGSICDPQVIADTQREIVRSAGVDI